jgi:hypothetical protein
MGRGPNNVFLIQRVLLLLLGWSSEYSLTVVWEGRTALDFGKELSIFLLCTVS